MRIADIQFSFPYLMVAIFMSAIFQVAFGIGRFERLAVPLLIVIIGLANGRCSPGPSGPRSWGRKTRSMWRPPGSSA
jgi:hypothetical protein